MEIRALKKEFDYRETIQRVEELQSETRDKPEGDEPDILCTLVEFGILLNE